MLILLYLGDPLDHTILLHTYKTTIVLLLKVLFLFFQMQSILYLIPLYYSKLTQTHKAFSIALLTNIETTHYNQAAQIPEWKEAMLAELQALAANDTYSNLFASREDSNWF